MSAKRYRNAVRAMARRWKKDAERLEALGLDAAVIADMDDASSEMIRNLETAITYAEIALGHSDEALEERIAPGYRA